MKKIPLLLTALSMLSVFTFSPVHADDASEHKMPPPHTGSPALEKVKSLAGDWIGKVRHEGLDEEAKETTASYRVTSNGSAVIETIFEGTPMEMTSVYYDHEGKLTMTHYCAVANRPVLSLVEGSGEVIKMSFSSGEELDVKKDMHIHGLELKIKDADSIVQTWKGYDGGKETHATILELTRAPSES